MPETCHFADLIKIRFDIFLANVKQIFLFCIKCGEKNGSFGFLALGEVVGKNQMCHLCGWLLQ
jgi:hypothetical protein